MKKRAFVCGLINFPHGGAASNYVQYFSSALCKAGYEVTIITNVNPEYEKLTDYHGFIIEKITIPHNSLLKKAFYKCYIGHAFVQILSKYSLAKDDRIIIYTHHSLMAKVITQYTQKSGAKAGICLVECFEPDDFPKGESDKQYIEEQKIYKIAQKDCDFIFPISLFIQNLLSDCKEKTLCLPVMTDTEEYSRKEERKDGIKRFIYPANGRIKDSLSDMLEAVKDILKSTQDKVEFHFCGVREDQIKIRLNEDLLRTELQRRIIIHKWMKYDELIELYQQMDFLLLAREDRQMTQANFPSKIPESLTLGVIPIVSNVGDYARIYLQDEVNCILMNGCSKEIIVAAIQKALQMNKETLLKMSKNARALAEEKFDYSVWSESIRVFLDG